MAEPLYRCLVDERFGSEEDEDEARAPARPTPDKGATLLMGSQPGAGRPYEEPPLPPDEADTPEQSDIHQMARLADILVVGAHAPDLAGLREKLGPQLEGNVRGLSLIAKPVGIGIPGAAASTARGLLAVRPRALILVGSCGVYPGQPDFRPYDVIVPSAVKLWDHHLAQGSSVFPEPMRTVIDCNAPLVAGLTAGPSRASQAQLACTLAQTVDDGLASRAQAANGCQGETMEAFAVATAANAAQVPFACALGVTHIVGSTARKDWMQFHRNAVNAAAQVVMVWLENGAPGLPHG